MQMIADRTSGRLVVTGASGFLGRHVVAELTRRGKPVIAVARTLVRDPATADWVQVSRYADTPAPPGATLIHLAEARDINAADANGAQHSEATIALVNLLIGKGYRRLVYISSAAVYEDCLTRPREPDEEATANGAYAQAKLGCEALVRNAGGVVLRLANLYGPGMAANNVMSDLLAQARSGEEPILLRDLTPVRDFLWVEDAAAGIVDAAEGTACGVFNLSTGQGTSIGQLAQTTLRLLGQPDRQVRGRSAPDRTSTLVLDFGATTTAFGWRPRTTLCAGLKRLLEAA